VTREMDPIALTVVVLAIIAGSVVFGPLLLVVALLLLVPRSRR
jgi:hypothetical protein